MRTSNMTRSEDRKLSLHVANDEMYGHKKEQDEHPGFKNAERVGGVFLALVVTLAIVAYVLG